MYLHPTSQLWKKSSIDFACDRLCKGKSLPASLSLVPNKPVDAPVQTKVTELRSCSLNFHVNSLVPCNHPSRLKLHTSRTTSQETDAPFWLDTCKVFELLIIVSPSSLKKLCVTVLLQSTFTCITNNWSFSWISTNMLIILFTSKVTHILGRCGECGWCGCSCVPGGDSVDLHWAAVWMTDGYWHPGRGAADTSQVAQTHDHQKSPQTCLTPAELGLLIGKKRKEKKNSKMELEESNCLNINVSC